MLLHTAASLRNCIQTKGDLRPLTREAFLRWRVKVLQERSARLEHRQVLQDGVVAKLMEEGDELRGIAEQSVNLYNRARRAVEGDRKSKCCMLCVDDASEWVACAEGHVVCLACVDAYCHRLSAARDMDARDVDAGDVACFASGECALRVPLTSLCRTNGGLKYAEAVYSRRMARRALSLVSRAHEDGEDGLSRLAVRLGYLRADGRYDAQECPHCSFGPIQHDRCADLTAHHGVRGVSNCCPRCGFFAETVDEFRSWSGEFA